MPKIKKNKPTSIVNVNEQLMQIDELQQDPYYLASIFDTAREYADKKGVKITREKDGVASKLLHNEGNEIIIGDLPNFPYSMLNFEDGQPYLLLQGTIFYDVGKFTRNRIDPLTTNRGIRKGKLAINANGAIFMVKIVEHYEAYNEMYCTDEANPEMNIEHEYAEAPYSTVTTRHILRENDLVSIKTYSLFIYRGFSSYDLVRERQLNSLQISDLAVQYLLCVFDLQARNIVHRDLKPANYTVKIKDDTSLDVSVIDYGYAKKMNDYAFFQHHDNTENAGTVSFIPPFLWDYPSEIWTYDFSTDIYAAAKSVSIIFSVFAKRRTHISEQEFNLLTDINNISSLIMNNHQFAADSKSLPALNQDYIKDQLISFKHKIDTMYHPREIEPSLVVPKISIPIVVTPEPATLTFEQNLVAQETTQIAPEISVDASKTSLFSKLEKKSSLIPIRHKIVPIIINNSNSFSDLGAFAMNDMSSIFKFSHSRQTSPVNKIFITPPITPEFETNNEDKLSAIKNAFSEAIEQYELNPQFFLRKSMCFYTKMHRPENIRIARSLRDNINSANNLNEIHVAVKKCFGNDLHESCRGIKNHSLISFILEKPVICETLNIENISLPQKAKPGFWHTSSAANDRQSAKNYMAKLFIEDDDSLTTNFRPNQAAHN